MHPQVPVERAPAPAHALVEPAADEHALLVREMLAILSEQDD